MIETMQRDLKELYKSRPGVSEDERDERLAKLDRELLDLELTEESIIRNAERAGLSITRRGDADARAVLAADEALP